MATESSSKVYGLSFPTKKPKDDTMKRVETVFNTNSDDDDGAIQLKPLEVNPKSRISAARLNRKTKSDFEKALEEDPSIFEYDEIYEDICNEKVEKTVTTIGKPLQKESRYVNRLIKTANERKLERELCSERKAHKEIEAEADLYGDKETFVTSAYKNKLNDLDELVKKRTEEEARENYMDVTKQEGLGGFYRYIYQHGTKPDSHGPKNSVPVSESKQERSPCKTTDQASDRQTSQEVEGRSHETVHAGTGKFVKAHNDHDSPWRNSHGRSSTRTSSSKQSTGLSLAPNRPGYNNPDVKMIPARQRVTSDVQLTEARERYLARKSAGIHPRIVDSDSD